MFPSEIKDGLLKWQENYFRQKLADNSAYILGSKFRQICSISHRFVCVRACVCDFFIFFFKLCTNKNYLHIYKSPQHKAYLWIC